MSRLLRILTAVVLTVHLMVGCCVHHAHACESERHSPPIQGFNTPQSDCDESPCNESDHGSQKCEGEKCSFVRSNPILNYLHTKPFQGFVIPLLGKTLSLTGIVSEQHFLTTGRLLLPIRLHLANQVLLI